MTDERYNHLFKSMVMTAICCGLYKPHEMICNYDMDYLSEKSDKDEFLNRAIVEIYSMLHARDLTFKEANKLYGEDLNRRG